LGFGSARWLPRKGSAQPETDPYVRVRNLFNPFVPLTDAIQWLVALKRKRQIKNYQKVEAVLARLLQLEPETRFPLRRENDEEVIFVQRPGRSIARSERLDQLSDGYQTVLAIAIAIVDMLSERWEWEMEAAEGLVLLDEIGAHLHPRWKLRIVESLRSAFPRVQFLASTHEPLCLRGLYDQEIVLMRRDADHRVWAITDLPSPIGLRVDQLLTSEHFGLQSTIDPAFEHLFDEYYELLLLKKRTPEQEDLLAEYKRDLNALGQMGKTRREQMMLEAIDEYLAREVTHLEPGARQREERKTKRTLAQILSEFDE
jgi:hypothetical protein